MDYADSTGLPDPDKLDQLYEEAVERADLADTNGSGPDEDNADSDDEVIELTEEELQQERKKAKEELKEKLQQNADDEPVEPSEGHSSTEDAGADGDYTLKEALRESAQEHGLT